MSAGWKQHRRSVFTDLAEGLRTLGALLSEHAPRHNISIDAGQLHRAASRMDSAAAGVEEPTYDCVLLFSALPVPAGAPSRLRPVRLRLQVDLSFRNGLDEAETRQDPLKSLSIGLELSAERKRGAMGRPRYASWHFDRHAYSCIPDRATRNQQQPEIHPRYHWHHGGDATGERDFGQYLRSAAPRLPHPPMDGVLAVDFVLANFAGHLWFGLRGDTRYQDVVAQSHRLLSLPYVRALAHHWHPEAGSPAWDCVEVWPSLADLTR